MDVLIDEPAVDREFTYLLPAELASGRVAARVGTIVRVPLVGRAVRGWITQLDAPEPDGVELLRIDRVLSEGPPPHVVELASWAAWRWAGTRAHFLRTASPDRIVTGLPSSRPASLPNGMPDDPSDAPEWVKDAFGGDHPPTVVRLGPCADEWPLVAEALRRGRVMVLVPTVAWAARLSGRLREAGVTTALASRDWADAAAAHAVVGTRSAAWAPCGSLDTVIVLDEHDEAYQQEAAPTWNARDVAVERARRDGARCLLVGPMPSPDTLATEPAVITTARVDEREAWPRVQIADRRQDDPATGEWCGEQLAELLRGDRSVVCVLNRKGRARLAYCASCGELATSRQSGRALRLEKQQFVEPDSGEVRPAVCESCGATRFRRARVGVKGVAEEMERLARRPVIQVVGEPARSAGAGSRTADAAGTLPVTRGTGEADARSPSRWQQRQPPATQVALYIGTEAVLHRVASADAVAFVDFDQELTAPRYRAGEEALALLVRAARLVGPRSRGGTILVQTRLPAHPVLTAAAKADPSDWRRAEVERRSVMRQPPAAAWALVSGAAAPGYIENLSAGLHAGMLDIAGPADGTWRIRGDDRVALLDALAAAERPSGRLRVAVDPLRA